MLPAYPAFAREDLCCTPVVVHQDNIGLIHVVGDIWAVLDGLVQVPAGFIISDMTRLNSSKYRGAAPRRAVRPIFVRHAFCQLCIQRIHNAVVWIDGDNIVQIAGAVLACGTPGILLKDVLSESSNLVTE